MSAIGLATLDVQVGDFGVILHVEPHVDTVSRDTCPDLHSARATQNGVEMTPFHPESSGYTQVLDLFKMCSGYTWTLPASSLPNENEGETTYALADWSGTWTLTARNLGVVRRFLLPANTGYWAGDSVSLKWERPIDDLDVSVHSVTFRKDTDDVGFSAPAASIEGGLSFKIPNDASNGVGTLRVSTNVLASLSRCDGPAKCTAAPQIVRSMPFEILLYRGP